MGHHTGHAVSATSTRNNRQDRHIGSFAPGACVRSECDDLASNLVTHDHAGGHVWLCLEIRSADSARVYPDDHLVGSRRRIGYFDDVEPMLLCCDRGPHVSVAFHFDVESRLVLAKNRFEIGDGKARTVERIRLNTEAVLRVSIQPVEHGLLGRRREIIARPLVQ